MKRIYLPIVAVLGITTLGLAACTPEEAAARVARIQNSTLAICSFLPTAATLVSAFNAPAGLFVVGINEIAQAICNQVRPVLGAKRGAGTKGYAIINGVRIYGHFVR